MSLATREGILGCKDADTSEIAIDCWGTLRIRSLTAMERLMLARDYAKENLTPELATEFYCKLIVLAVVDEAGDQVFVGEDLDGLQAKNWRMLEQAAQEILRFNGLTADAVEDREKNSVSDR